MSIIDRLLYALDTTGISQTDLCTYIDVGTSTISNWKNRKTDPPAKYIFPICEKMNLSIKWLLIGEGEIQKKIEMQNTVDEIELLNRYKKLSREDKIKVMERAQTLLDLKEEVNNTPPAEPGKIVEFKKPRAALKQIGEGVSAAEPSTVYGAPPADEPSDIYDERRKVEQIVYNQKPTAGYGNYLHDDSSYELMSFYEDEVPAKADYGLRISGDSMEPEIADGEIVWIEAKMQIESGQIGIFILNNEAYCKRLRIDHKQRKVYLCSTNPKYEPIEVNECDFLHTVGRVIL